MKGIQFQSGQKNNEQSRPKSQLQLVPQNNTAKQKERVASVRVTKKSIQNSAKQNNLTQSSQSRNRQQIEKEYAFFSQQQQPEPNYLSLNESSTSNLLKNLKQNSNCISQECLTNNINPFSTQRINEEYFSTQNQDEALNNNRPSSKLEEKQPLPSKTPEKDVKQKQSSSKPVLSKSKRSTKLNSVSSSLTQLPVKNKIQQKTVNLTINNSNLNKNNTPLKPRTHSQLNETSKQQQIPSKRDLLISQSTAQLQLQVEEKQQQQQFEEDIQPPVFKEIQNNQQLQDINSKVDILLNKYKNVSYFNSKIQQEQEQSKQDALKQQEFNVNNNKSYESQKLQDINIKSFETLKSLENTKSQEVVKLVGQKPLIENKFLDNKDNNLVNQYVTRISKGVGFSNSKFKKDQTSTNNRKRMNSPIHTKQAKENHNSLLSQREVRSAAKLQRSISSEKKITRPLSVNQKNIFISPFVDFRYYLSFLQYFHQEFVSINSALKSKVQKHFANKEEYFDGIYKEHFVQNFHALQFCKDIKIVPFSEIQRKIVQLPPIDRKKCRKYQFLFLDKKTIVFDLDETLIHCNENNENPADVRLPINFPTGEIVEAGINIRPYCIEMLKQLSQNYEIIVFTASHECYASKVLNYLDPEKKLFQHKFYRDSCIVATDGLHIKDLRILGNRNLKDIVIVDNASYSFYFQMENGIPIIPFYDNQDDRELIYLTGYLNELLIEQDMVKKNANYFKLQIYLDEEIPEDVLPKLFE